MNGKRGGRGSEVAEQKEKVGKGAEGMQKEEERGGLKWMRLEGASGKLQEKQPPGGRGLRGQLDSV